MFKLIWPLAKKPPQPLREGACVKTYLFRDQLKNDEKIYGSGVLEEEGTL